MFSGLKDWFMKKLFGDYAKKLLDYIPANGRKTFLSVALIALSVASQLFPEVSEVLQKAAGFLLQMGAEDFRDAGIVGALVGLFHKFLKGKEGDE